MEKVEDPRTAESRDESRVAEASAAPSPGERLGEPRPFEPAPPLGLGARILLLIFGWLLILLGLVQLVIPGPGVLTLLMGAAVLSLVSENVHRVLRRIFLRWPRAWKYLLAFRRRVHGWFHRPPPPDDRR